MKKLSILLSGVLALAAFSACDDAPEAAKPQKNPQPALFTNADVAATFAGPLTEASAPGAEPLKLQNYRESGVITLMENVTYTDVPAGSEIVFELQISPEADFSVLPSTTPLLATTDADGKAVVLTSDWNAAHYDLAGKSMTPKKFYYRVFGYISLDNSRYYIGEADPADASKMVPKVFAQGHYQEIPFELIIDSAYYFLSDATTWTFAEAAPYKFSHSDQDVYEDPVFTFKFEVTEEKLKEKNDAIYWKIASQAALDNENWDDAYGPSINGDQSLSGQLIKAGQAGKIVEAGKYTMTINMEDMTYELVKQTRPEFVIVANNANGWNPASGKSALYWSNKEEAEKQYFCGAAVVNNKDGGFKFVWDGTWHGQDFSTAPDAKNIKAPVDDTRLYWFTVDTEKPAYTIAEVTSLGIIGVTGWDVDSNVIEMTPSEDYLTWTVDTKLSGNWKIIINHSWNSNYGGDIEGLVFDGGNIEGYDGDYTVTLSFNSDKPTLSITAK